VFGNSCNLEIQDLDGIVKSQVKGELGSAISEGKVPRMSHVNCSRILGLVGSKRRMPGMVDGTWE
jgi:hypothetical protein